MWVLVGNPQPAGVGAMVPRGRVEEPGGLFWAFMVVQDGEGVWGPSMGRGALPCSEDALMAPTPLLMVSCGSLWR